MAILNFLIILQTIMNYKNHLQHQPSLDIDAKVIDAKSLFDQYNKNVLLILSNSIYKGLLFEKDIKNQPEDKPLFELEAVLKPVYLTADFSIFDWFKISSLYEIDSIPMIDSSDFSYINIIEYKDFIEKFKETGLNVELSSILILKQSTADFVYSEVFQIAEAHDAKVFGSYINYSDENSTEIILNIYHIGLNELLQSYRRYGFDVISLHNEDLHHETLKTNSDYFSKYLTV